MTYYTKHLRSEDIGISAAAAASSAAANAIGEVLDPKPRHTS